MHNFISWGCVGCLAICWKYKAAKYHRFTPCVWKLSSHGKSMYFLLCLHSTGFSCISCSVLHFTDCYAGLVQVLNEQSPTLQSPTDCHTAAGRLPDCMLDRFSQEKSKGLGDQGPYSKPLASGKGITLWCSGKILPFFHSEKVIEHNILKGWTFPGHQLISWKKPLRLPWISDFIKALPYFQSI